jgi:hypothetical protein
MDQDLHAAVQPVFRRVLKRTEGRIVISEIRKACVSDLPTLSKSAVFGAIDELALDHLMEQAANQGRSN